MKVTIEIKITEQEIKDLKLIRNYFGEHDLTMLEHLAYNELDKLVKKLTIPAVVGRSEQLCGLFEADSKTSSDTKCKCGREKWEHPKAT